VLFLSKFWKRRLEAPSTLRPERPGTKEWSP
jgi:hypothetical protein